MSAEYIFLQTDPTFNLALFITRELSESRRMVVESQSSVEMINIESNVDGDANLLHFGAQGNSIRDFSRTAGAVFRMCMLRATNIPRHLWPQQNNPMETRNTTKMVYLQIAGDPFTLANQIAPARHYWSKYDQLYPHYVIEDKIERVGLGRQATLPSMMFIFRYNSQQDIQQVIEITTTANATQCDQPDNHFDSYVYVLVTVRSIQPGEDGNCLKVLNHIIKNEYRALHNGVGALEQLGALNLSNWHHPAQDQGDEDCDACTCM